MTTLRLHIIYWVAPLILGTLIGLLLVFMAGCGMGPPTVRNDVISVVVNGGCIDPDDVSYIFASIEAGQKQDVPPPAVAVWCEQCPQDQRPGAVGCTSWGGMMYPTDPFQVYAPRCETLVHEMMHVYLYSKYLRSKQDHSEPEWEWVDEKREEVCDDVPFVDQPIHLEF